jgi:putative ABC transport system permease protein
MKLDALRYFFRRWTWTMAWRDTRASRRRLLLFSASIVMGIAALVAIRSFARSAEQAIDEQSRTLLGADLSITSRQAISSEEEDLFASLGGRQAREIDFSSMIYFPEAKGTRLVQVRAIGDGFPFYGTFETVPADAIKAFRAGSGVLVDDSLAHQFGVKAGDPVRLGDLETSIAGTIQRAPGESIAIANFAPRVYLPFDQVSETGLLRLGSLARYRVHFKFGAETNVASLVKEIRPQLQKHRLNVHTVETRREDLGRAMDDVSNYLNLAGFVALLLGGIGVASGIHVHVKQKLETVAVLRCLGSGVAQTFAIYVVQALLVGLVGGLLGAALGVSLQQAFPLVLKDLLPVDIVLRTDWMSVLEAIGQGLLIALLFGLLPLLDVRRVSPLAAIRADYQPPRPVHHDWMVWLIYALIGGGIVFFCIQHSRVWRHGLIFAAAIGAAFLLLGVVARAAVWLVRRLPVRRLPYVWRQGLANLYRPQNRTVLLVLSLGLGTFLILCIYLVQHALVSELLTRGAADRANLALFDIQSDQKAGVRELMRAHHVVIVDEAPVVTMRLAAIKGRSVEDILTDTNRTMPNWVLRREYRSTYGARLRGGERIIAGEWPPSGVSKAPAAGASAKTPISLEEGIARQLGVHLGDEIVFDVQGVPIPAEVHSLRQVEWRRMQPNFFVVFPPGVLDDAPASHIVVARVESSERSGDFQRALVETFPNVSAIDLTLVLQTLDAIFSRIATAVRFMASFTVVTGILVLIAAVLTGRYQRIRESVLLRSLGASRRQVFAVLLAEYMFLGLLSALVGALLAVGGAWLLTRTVFHISFVPAYLAILAALISVPVLTILIGLLTSRGILNLPPLEVLRAD